MLTEEVYKIECSVENPIFLRTRIDTGVSVERAEDTINDRVLLRPTITYGAETKDHGAI